ncbi:proteasome inhibitor PI31 subunit-like isoform X2 [Choristoneura fumiferana]|uniref:proteasome inhibitor PI31 subunit-like isoform X2 n=1 Tax=Choristoneura fumiferana TaxID=7141 RepID=UPI003D15D914
MAADPLYGWDLTFKTVERDIRRKSDVLIAFIHWNLSKRGFRTIGIGDELTLTGDEEKSEVLPTGWNDKDNYTLRYVLEGKLYILHGLNTDGTLIVNLMRSDDLAVSNMAVKIEDAVKETSGSINKLMPTHTELMHNVKRDLIDTITEKPTSSAETQTLGDSNSRRPPDDPLRVPPRPHPSGPHPDTRDLWELPPANLPNIGRSDLDPFAPGGGGMLFNPFGPRRDPENPGLGIPGGLPRGAVPPGARFDPFGPPMGPPIPGRRPPPDADHLPPPGGFNDNMFM